MPKSEIYRPLETLQPEFERCANSYPQLRCLWGEWDYRRPQGNGRVMVGAPQPSHLDVEPMLVQAGKIAFRRGKHVEAWFFGDSKADGKGVGNAAMLFGDASGATEFGELAKAAGGVLGRHTPDHLPATISAYRTGSMIGNTSSGRAYRWCHALLAQARRVEDGSTLHADFVSVAGSGCNLMHAALHINPFLASLLLIDTLKDSSDQSDTISPFMPADWFLTKFGIPSDRLRAARRDKRLAAKNVNKAGKRPRYLYSVQVAKELWPDDGIYLPFVDG